MFQITLIYKKFGETKKTKMDVQAVPRMGERVILPDDDMPATVLMVEHDLRTDPVNIMVVVD